MSAQFIEDRGRAGGGGGGGGAGLSNEDLSRRLEVVDRTIKTMSVQATRLSARYDEAEHNKLKQEQRRLKQKLGLVARVTPGNRTPE